MAAVNHSLRSSPSPRRGPSSRHKITQARRALSAPAHEVARRSRARYHKAGRPTRIPSRKPHVVAARKEQNSFVWVMRMFGVGVIISLFVVVAIQTIIAKRQISIDALRSQQKEEITRYQKLRHDVAELKSPERITRRATYLGLVQPARFVSVTIPMELSPRSDVSNDELWSEVKAIINVTS